MDASQSLGQPRLYISRTALLHNVGVLRSKIAATTKLCAVLKADAYGHGAALIADALCNFSSARAEAPAADMLAVATIDEAAALGPCAVPIIVLRPVENIFIGRHRERLELAIREGWTLTVCSVEAARDLARIAVGCARQCHVQVMIDTGMSREGVPVEEAEATLGAVEASLSLRLRAICTHFTNSEESPQATGEQLARFETATQLRAWKNPKLIRHAANSGATFFSPQSHLDMIRPGISLYGMDPTVKPTLERPLRPVLKWTARLHQVRTVRKGETVGYGQTWKASRDTRIGLVPVGYADGYLRAFSNRAVMMVAGSPAPVVGRVSMDFTTIDLTNIPQAQGGDVVTILDNDPLSPASAYALADAAQTIPYEIFCRIGPRVARVGIDPVDAEEPALPDQELEQRRA